MNGLCFITDIKTVIDNTVECSFPEKDEIVYNYNYAADAAFKAEFKGVKINTSGVIFGQYPHELRGFKVTTTSDKMRISSLGILVDQKAIDDIED
jgi:hypothetical protein